MSIARKAAGAAKSAAKGAAHAVNEAFEDLHPRARKGLPNAGEFVEVRGRLEALGGVFNAQTGSWRVPQDSRAEIDALLNEINFESLSVPFGFTQMTPQDRRKLRIPPASTLAYMNPDPKGDLVAVHWDLQGRRQDIRSAAATARGARTKYARVSRMTEHMPAFDAAFTAQAGHDDTALVAMLIRMFGIRPGDPHKDNKGKVKSYGALTLQREHVSVSGSVVTLDFIGKHGVRNNPPPIDDPELAKFLKARLRGKKTGDRLFEGTHARGLRNWIKEQVPPDFVPKDFRTHLANVVAVDAISGMDIPRTKGEWKAFHTEVGDHVATFLSNDGKEALRSYINPGVFDAWPELNSLPNAQTIGGTARLGKAPKLRAKVPKVGESNAREKAQRASRSKRDQSAVTIFGKNPPFVNHLLLHSEISGQRRRKSSAPSTPLRPGFSNPSLRPLGGEGGAQGIALPGHAVITQLDDSFKRNAPLDVDIEVSATFPLSKLPGAPEIARGLSRKTSVAELRERLEDRGLDTRGDKNTLLARLKADLGTAEGPGPKAVNAEHAAQVKLEKMSKSELALEAKRRGKLAEVEDFPPADDPSKWRRGKKLRTVEGDDIKVVEKRENGVLARFKSGEERFVPGHELTEPVGTSGVEQLSKADLIELLRDDFLTEARGRARTGDLDELDHLIGHQLEDPRYVITTADLKKTAVEGDSDIVETRILVRAGERPMLLDGGRYVFERDRKWRITGIDKSVVPPRLLMELI
jgi:DNA topoisomerase-1